MDKVERYINEDGKVGVLISPGYGAGWSTWNDYKEFCLFDKGLVELKLNDASEDELEEYIKSDAVRNEMDIGTVYCGGWEDVVVEFVEPNETFVVDEYDGHESLEYLSCIRTFTA